MRQWLPASIHYSINAHVSSPVSGGPSLQPLPLLDRRAQGRRLARWLYALCYPHARRNCRARVSSGNRRAGRVRADHRLDRRVQSDLGHLQHSRGKVCRWEPGADRKDRVTRQRTVQGAGWLYAIEGKPDSRCTDVHGYVGLLDATIDKMLDSRNIPHTEKPTTKARYIMIGGFLGAGKTTAILANSQSTSPQTDAGRTDHQRSEQ